MPSQNEFMKTASLISRIVLFGSDNPSAHSAVSTWSMLRRIIGKIQSGHLVAFTLGVGEGILDG